MPGPGTSTTAMKPTQGAQAADLYITNSTRDDLLVTGGGDNQSSPITHKQRITTASVGARNYANYTRN